jgi:hypothetical protein
MASVATNMLALLQVIDDFMCQGGGEDDTCACH